jgi:hypothetical protein
MRKRLLLVAAGALLGGLAVGVIQITSAGAISAISKAESFVLVAPDTAQTELDFRRGQGGTRGPSQGDQLIFSGPVHDEGDPEARRGRIDGVCTTTSTPAGQGTDQHRRICVVTVTLGGVDIEEAENEGEIYLQGVGRIEAEDVILGVTGGNEDFRNARGQATFDYTTEGQATISFELIP